MENCVKLEGDRVMPTPDMSEARLSALVSGCCPVTPDSCPPYVTTAGVALNLSAAMQLLNKSVLVS